MKVVTPLTEEEYVDRMVAMALEGKITVYYSDDLREIEKIKVKFEKHLDQVIKSLPETKVYWTNERFVVDNRGRKGYILIADNIESLRGIQVTAAFVHYAVPHQNIEFLATRENDEVRGGTYEKGLRW